MKKGKKQDQAALIVAFKADLKDRNLSADTVTQYPQYVHTFYDFTGGNLLGVDDETLIRYLAHLRQRGLGQSTIKRYFASLAAFYDFLMFKKQIAANPVSSMFRKRYLKDRKTHDTSQRRQCITVDQAKLLVGSILDNRERAVVVLLLKTGMRRHELSELDLDDVDLPNQVIRLKPTAKRSFETAFIDDETIFVLNRWIKLREKDNKKQIPALFLDKFGNRLSKQAIARIVRKHAAVVGLHDPNSTRKQLQKRFSSHCCRHFWATAMFDAGMSREMIKKLRGDSQQEAVDGYYDLTIAKLKARYLACIPKLDIL